MRVEKITLRGTAHRIFWEQILLPRELKKISADAALYPFFVKSLASKLPSVVIIHDALEKAYPNLIEPARRLYLNTFINASVKSATRIITVSEFAKQDIALRYGVSTEKIGVAAAASDDIFSTPISDATRRDVLKRHHVPFDNFFLTVGTLSKYKNYEEALQAFFAAYQTNPSMRLVMVGSNGNDTASIQQFIARQGLTEAIHRVEYVSPEDLRAFYASASALVMTSHYESFGMPILEAMQLGCPVIVANRAAMPEIANGAACLFESSDELVLCLKRLWQEPVLRETYAQKGRERAKIFSWKEAAKVTLSMFDKL